MLKVAFATADRQSANQHFGAATGFAIYALDETRSRLVGVVEFAPESMDGNENKLAAKIAALKGCAAVYCTAVGASAVRQLLASGVQPIRLEAPESIESILAGLRVALREGGVPWLHRARRREDSGRFARMAAEGWSE